MKRRCEPGAVFGSFAVLSTMYHVLSIAPNHFDYLPSIVLQMLHPQTTVVVTTRERTLVILSERPAAKF